MALRTGKPTHTDDYPRHTVPPAAIMEVVEGCLHTGTSCTPEYLSQYTGVKTIPYVESSIDAAVHLGMLGRDPAGHIIPTPHCKKALSGQLTAELKLAVFRSFLGRWKPYVAFLALLAAGNPPSVAARKVAVRFQIKKSHDSLLNLFAAWGKTAGHLSGSGVSLRLAQDVQTKSEEITQKIASAATSDVAARVFVAAILGPDAYDYLDDDERDELVAAILKHRKHHGESIESAGRALEDFLRRISNDIGKDVSKQSGIAEIGNALYNNKDSSGAHAPLIHAKHLAILQGTAAIRTMAAHGKDRKAMERWQLDEASSASFTLQAIKCIRSVHAFTKASVLTF